MRGRVLVSGCPSWLLWEESSSFCGAAGTLQLEMSSSRTSCPIRNVKGLLLFFFFPLVIKFFRKVGGEGALLFWVKGFRGLT